MIRITPLLLLAIAAGCSSPPAPITDPPPFGSPDQEVVYLIEIPGRSDVHGLMVETSQGEREQIRTTLNAEGEVAFRSVREVSFRSGELVSFRYQSRGPKGEQRIEGKVAEGSLRVSQDGVALPPLEWSRAHRLGGPAPSDVAATGFKPGATVTAPCYLMTHDAKAIHLVRYTVKGPTVWRAPSGLSQPGHTLTIQSPQQLLNGTEWIVDERGRLLETSVPLPSLGREVRIRLTSRIEREVTEQAPGR